VFNVKAFNIKITPQSNAFFLFNAHFLTLVNVGSMSKT